MAEVTAVGACSRDSSHRGEPREAERGEQEADTTANVFLFVTSFCQKAPTFYRLRSLPKSHHQFGTNHTHGESEGVISDAKSDSSLQ